MLDAQRFPFTEKISNLGLSSTLPYLPVVLTYRNQFLETIALLDTGASVNVLPRDMGLQLGAVWEEQTVPVQLGGNLASLEARGLVVSAIVAGFSPVLLAFAWTASQKAPLILGHMNFFAEFDVCFYRASLAFDIRPKRQQTIL